MWDPTLHETRLRMVRMADNWVRWRHERGFESFICTTLREQRSALIALAFVAIGLAENIEKKPDTVAPWWWLGELWAGIFGRPVTG